MLIIVTIIVAVVVVVVLSLSSSLCYVPLYLNVIHAIINCIIVSFFFFYRIRTNVPVMPIQYCLLLLRQVI